ncbi:MAG: hypothetical protein P8Z50_04670, partial [candidate division WOR-3 bacterium]
ARILELSGNISDALSTYKELPSEKEKNSFYLLKIGILEERLGNIDEAEKYFRKALKFSKGEIKEDAVYHLVYLLVKNKKVNEASNLFSDFKKERKDLSLRLKFIEGRILCAKGEFEKTMKIVKKELKKDLSTEMERDFLVLGGLAKMQDEKHPEAVHYFQKCIDIARKEKDILHEAMFMNNKGLSLLRIDSYKEALEELE